MTNIWMFLNQTLGVSTVAVILLFIKGILRDKLSPRWQYGVWIILVFRILIPVNVNKVLFVAFSLFIEHIRGVVEADVYAEYGIRAYEKIGKDYNEAKIVGQSRDNRAEKRGGPDGGRI